MSNNEQKVLASQRGETAKRGYFPLSYKDGFSQWWASISPAAAEHKVLSYIPYLGTPPTQQATGNTATKAADSLDPTAGENAGANDTDDVSRTVSHTAESKNDPYGPRKWHSTLVKLPGKDRAINEFSVERVGEDVENNFVMLHGYGAGLGFFYKNFEPMSRREHWRLYALDMLGMGRSSRPPFRIHSKDREGKIREAENWFVDALEEWRVEKKIERFTLLGHSLGGYMAVCYALKYPGRLNKLILASPVGIPEDPYAMQEPMPDAGGEDGVGDIVQGEMSNGKDGNNFLNAKSKNAANANTNAPAKRPYSKWFTWLWDQNVSVFSFVRWSGPLGPRLVSGWTSRRFSQMPQEEASALHDYSYSLFRQRGSGEYALSYVLAPGAYARSPLIRRIGQIGRGTYIPSEIGPNVAAKESSLATTAEEKLEKVKENGVPVVFMYGDGDWMDKKGGYAGMEELAEAKKRAQDEQASNNRPDQSTSKVLIVKGAGHHLYLDGYEEFNQMMGEEMKDVERRQRESKI